MGDARVQVGDRESTQKDGAAQQVHLHFDQEVYQMAKVMRGS